MRKILVPVSLAFLGLALLSAGCAPKKVKVSGKLVKDGTPQTFAENEYVTVTFRPEKTDDETKGSSSYPAQLNRTAGTYEVELPPGRYIVNVFVPPKLAPGAKKPPMGPPPAGDKAGGNVHEITGTMTLDLPVP